MISQELQTLAQYITGEFDNKEQAAADPAWYVHLRVWQVIVPFFTEDSITIFAEQANIMSLHRPYRPRLMRLQQKPDTLQVQYYMPKDPAAVNGATTNPALLETLTIEHFELLPGCLLDVKVEHLADDKVFTANLAPDCRCCFNYAGEVREVSLGFTASKDEFLSYDKGIDSTTGKALWGAILGPFRFRKY